MNTKDRVTAVGNRVLLPYATKDRKNKFVRTLIYQKGGRGDFVYVLRERESAGLR